MKTRLLALSALSAALSLTAACGSGGGSEGGGKAAAPVAVTDTATASPETSATEPAPTSPATSPTASASATPFGTGCAGVPTSVSSEPVGKAIGDIPSLSTLAQVIRRAELVRTLNKASDITIFAPTNEAFAKAPKKKLDRLAGDRQALSALLAYHVVRGRKSPADLQAGKLTSLQGGELKTSGSGQSFKVNDANVVCGDVVTRNATIYMIDKVLLPK